MQKVVIEICNFYLQFKFNLIKGQVTFLLREKKAKKILQLDATTTIKLIYTFFTQEKYFCLNWTSSKSVFHFHTNFFSTFLSSLNFFSCRDISTFPVVQFISWVLRFCHIFFTSKAIICYDFWICVRSCRLSMPMNEWIQVCANINFGM